MKRSYRTWIITGTLLFIGLMVWYTSFHPCVVLTQDDWMYIGYGRAGYPTWRSWNPTRILPEVLMPFCGLVGAKLIYPLTGDYMGALSVSIAIVVSLAVTVYICAFGCYAAKVLKLSDLKAVVAALLFFLMHFYAVKTNDAANDYLFGANTPTHIFFYTIPVMLNATIIMYMQTVDDLSVSRNGKCLLNRGMLFLAIYLAIFSNLYSSGVLCIYAATSLVFKGVDLLADKKNREDNAVNAGEAAWYIIIIALWLVSAVFEYNGGRSASVEKDLLTELPGTLSVLWENVAKLRPIVGIIGALVLVFAVAAFKQQDRAFCVRTVLRFACCALLETVYLVGLSAKVNATYLNRIHIRIGIYVFLLMLFCFCAAYLLKRWPKVLLAIPLVMFLLICSTNTEKMTFKEGAYLNLYPAVAKQIGSYYSEKIIEADSNGIREMTLEVPHITKDYGLDNWPFYKNYGQKMANALYKHGMISYPVKVATVPSDEENKKFTINKEFQHIEIEE